MPGQGTGSGLSRAAIVGTLTSPQLATLCDWSASRRGGYGYIVPCGNEATLGTYPSQMTCISDIGLYSAPCDSLTVGDYEDCMTAVGPDECLFITTDNAGCMALRDCFAGI